MTVITAMLAISVLCYLFGTLYSPRAQDFREELVNKRQAVDEVRSGILHGF